MSKNAPTYIRREIESVFLEASQDYAAVLLTGAPFVGKTTMLRTLSDVSRSYVSLNDLFARNFAQTDPAGFLQKFKPPVLIDEVAYAPELFPYLKIAADTGATAGSYWLTTSRSIDSNVAFGALAGRLALLQMSSLSESEIQGCQDEGGFEFTLNFWQNRARKRRLKTLNKVFSRIWQGSLPQIVTASIDRHHRLYAEIVSDLVCRHVNALLPGIDPVRFFRFVVSLTQNTAQELNWKTLTEQSQIDTKSAKLWLSVLERLGLVFFVQPYPHTGLGRTRPKEKLYFEDTGLVAYLTRYVSPEILEVGSINGAIYENYIVTEIMKSFRNRGLEPYLWYYRDFDQKEIDLILETNGQLHPVAITKAVSPDTSMIRNFAQLEKAQLPVGTGALICMSPNVSALNTNTLVIPAWAL